MYSALAKLFAAFFGTVIWTMIGVFVIMLILAVAESALEIAQYGGWLPHSIRHFLWMVGY
jgi:hypothetical protein